MASACGCAHEGQCSLPPNLLPDRFSSSPLPGVIGRCLEQMSRPKAASGLHLLMRRTGCVDRNPCGGGCDRRGLTMRGDASRADIAVAGVGLLDSDQRSLMRNGQRTSGILAKATSRCNIGRVALGLALALRACAREALGRRLHRAKGDRKRRQRRRWPQHRACASMLDWDNARAARIYRRPPCIAAVRWYACCS